MVRLKGRYLTAHPHPRVINSDSWEQNLLVETTKGKFIKNITKNVIVETNKTSRKWGTPSKMIDLREWYYSVLISVVEMDGQRIMLFFSIWHNGNLSGGLGKGSGFNTQSLLVYHGKTSLKFTILL